MSFPWFVFCFFKLVQELKVHTCFCIPYFFLPLKFLRIIVRIIGIPNYKFVNYPFLIVNLNNVSPAITLTFGLLSFLKIITFY